MASQYQCTDLPAHEKAICGNYLRGGNSSIGLLETDHAITNFSSASQYTTAINTGKLVILEPLVGELPAPSPIEGANPSGCGAATILDDFDRTYVAKDYNVDGNIDLVDAMNNKKTYLIIYECANEKVTVVLTEVSWTVFRVIPPNEREKQYLQITGKWTSKSEPAIYTAPAGIFMQ